MSTPPEPGERACRNPEDTLGEGEQLAGSTSARCWLGAAVASAVVSVDGRLLLVALAAACAMAIASALRRRPLPGLATVLPWAPPACGWFRWVRV